MLVRLIVLVFVAMIAAGAGLGHGDLYGADRCAMTIAAAFVERPQSRPDDSCIAALGPPAWVLTARVPPAPAPQPEPSPEPVAPVQPVARPPAPIGIRAPNTGTGVAATTPRASTLLLLVLAMAGAAAVGGGVRLRRTR